MGNFRPDKKIKRKKNYKDWRKKNNILKNWQGQHKREGLGKAGGLPIRFPKKKKTQ